jgi:hypothetical protein
MAFLCHVSCRLHVDRFLRAVVCVPDTIQNSRNSLKYLVSRESSFKKEKRAATHYKPPTGERVEEEGVYDDVRSQEGLLLSLDLLLLVCVVSCLVDLFFISAEGVNSWGREIKVNEIHGLGATLGSNRS